MSRAVNLLIFLLSKWFLCPPCFGVEVWLVVWGLNPTNVIAYGNDKYAERQNGRFWRYNGPSKPITEIPRFGYVGLAKVQYRQNFGMQGGKGGDFSAKRFEKYYPTLAWRKAIILEGVFKMEKSIEEKLKEFAELNRKSKKKPRKLKSDGFGNVLLDPNNPDDVEWYENDEEYDFDFK